MAGYYYRLVLTRLVSFRNRGTPVGREPTIGGQSLPGQKRAVDSYS